MVGFLDKVITIKQCDEFFQLQKVPGSNFFPSSLFSSNILLNATFYICNFEGWSACLIQDTTLVKDYIEKYNFCIEVNGSDAYITIWCWKPRHALVGGPQQAGHWGKGSAKEACRGDREICELFKAVHAPISKGCFDEWGQITLVSHLGDICEDSVGSPMEVEMQGSQQLLPQPHWVPATHLQLAIPSPASPLNVALRWVQSMLASSSLSSSRASSAACHSHGSGKHDFHRCSASPDCSRAKPKDQVPGSRAAFIEELRDLGGQYSGIANVWASKKPLSWNAVYLDVGYLLVPDIGAQACLRYWAACSQDSSTMSEILFKAVTHGTPFSISIKVEDFGKFKPEEVLDTDTDHLVGKPMCVMEPPFAYMPPRALKAYYLSCINDIIW